MCLFSRKCELSRFVSIRAAYTGFGVWLGGACSHSIVNMETFDWLLGKSKFCLYFAFVRLFVCPVVH